MTFDINYIIQELHKCNMYTVNAGKYSTEYLNKQKTVKTEHSIPWKKCTILKLDD